MAGALLVFVETLLLTFWSSDLDTSDKDLLDDPIGPCLDLAKDCLLLRRLGDSDDHLFVHLLLRDYFADLWDDEKPNMERIREITAGL